MKNFHFKLSQKVRNIRLKNILTKLLILSWLIIVFTLSIFVVAIIPSQKEALFRSMELQAKNLATSVAVVTFNSLAVEDYAAVIDHCTQVVNEQTNILYLVITRRDGTSNIFRHQNWTYSQLGGMWTPSEQLVNKGNILDSDLVNKSVFHYSYPLKKSGIDIGWIHTGLSLEEFSAELHTIYIRTSVIAIITILFGFVFSFYFARLISRPIYSLNEMTQKIASGDLTARANIKTGDEIEDLAHSFNRMAKSVQHSREQITQAKDQLEVRVLERTAELSKTNKQLQLEIGERKVAEDKIKNSLREKEVLLKEIHHRVKNNLQVISSLLYLQSNNTNDKATLELLQESQNRVKSMALIHERLYKSHNLAIVDFREYIQNLTGYLFRTYRNNDLNIRLKLDVADVYLNLNYAIPCGLIINELVSNSLKYAFTSQNGNNGHYEIMVSLNQNRDGEFTLCVCDNGVGFPEDIDIKNTKSLGMQLVCSLTQQLEGVVELKRDSGTKIKITFGDDIIKE